MAGAIRIPIPRRCRISSRWRKPSAASVCAPTKPSELDGKIKEMLAVRRPVLFDVRVDPAENCYPMIPSGAAHNEMLLSPDDGGEISDAGKMLV